MTNPYHTPAETIPYTEYNKEPYRSLLTGISHPKNHPTFFIRMSLAMAEKSFWKSGDAPVLDEDGYDTGKTIKIKMPCTKEDLKDMVRKNFLCITDWEFDINQVIDEAKAYVAKKHSQCGAAVNLG